MKITTYEYKKYPVKDTEVFIPEEPFYCFQTGVRRAIRMIPKFVTWDTDSIHAPYQKGDIYELEITCVYQSFECTIDKFNLSISDIEGKINGNEKGKYAEICRMLIQEDYHKRTKEQFDIDLKNTLHEINSVD